MKNIIILLFICVFNSATFAQDTYRSHTVQKGETVYSIAKKYGISKKEIYSLNPDVKNGMKTNTILILPITDIINSENPGIVFKKHKVKRKETLFSISQRYDVSIEEIKKYNKQLYSAPLKKRDILMIPVEKKSSSNNSTTTTVTTNTNHSSETSTYTVQPKDSKYGIARKFGITIAELEELNPDLGESLKIGTVLTVPKVSVVDSASIEEENFEFYEVQPKEGFFRLKVKLGLTKEEIITLNPYAKDGLKEGMILKIPKENTENSTDKIPTVNLENGIINVTKKNLVVMLPFRLQRTDSDSISNNIGLLKEDRTLRIALDFYSGVLMATEFAKDKGISVHVDVYDTEASERKVSSIISQNDFKNVDAVIGPLLEKNVVKAVSLLKSTDTPVFSPLSNREMRIYSNLFQTLPTNTMLEKAMLDYLNENSSGKNIILICDNKRSKQKATILTALPDIKVISPRKGKNGEFLYIGDIDTKIDKGLENWVILESVNPVLVSNVVALLNGMPVEYKLRLFTLDKRKVYDYHDISNIHLANLNFTFPSIKRDYDHKEPNSFITSYKNKYGVLPNKFAIRGFDVTYDVLLRLASADDVYDATKNDFVTEYIENKFRYTKKMFSGYQNVAFYIIKYNNDLQVEVVK